MKEKPQPKTITFPRAKQRLATKPPLEEPPSVTSGMTRITKPMGQRQQKRLESLMRSQHMRQIHE
jgi:hypothetical protein